ncbi:serine/threonine-protein kinase [Myxococcus qinghaiensis]|uniref:serine/threonine-protein kinase n=1 Tax=Myxococcus qinghaiensis TaxID=2906758 RepID=UPI0020A7D310|nr:serine/threonine protein kinase [Myxococcus qinghaiensis]MCP3165847.1 protein kinase [Myxococcus qinghaiensis]
MDTSQTTRGERGPRVNDSLISTQVNDFIIEERIGEGGMGVVYRAVHPLIGKQVAIKVLRAEYVAQQQVERLIIEARAVNSIRHAGIIDIFGFGRLPDARPYIIMELLRGQSLSTSLKQLGRLDPNTTVWILDQILSALGAAHKAGVVHRDMKPGNVFLAETLDGSRAVRLVDFGIAKLVRDHDGPTTVDGTILGTPEYMAPEQIRGTTVSSATDLYAVGIMAFQMLTGERPFKGEQVQVLFAHVEQPPPLPSSRAPGIPPELDTIVLHLLAKDPAMRPESAEAVREALRRVPPTVLPPLGTGPTGVLQPAARESETKSTWSKGKLARPTARPRRVWMAVGGALLTAGAAATFLLSPWKSGGTSGLEATPVAATAHSADAPRQKPREHALVPVPPPPTQQASADTAPDGTPTSAQHLAANAPSPDSQGATPPTPAVVEERAQPSTSLALKPPAAPAGPEGNSQPSASMALKASATPAVSHGHDSTTLAVQKAAPSTPPATSVADKQPVSDEPSTTPRHPAAFLHRGTTTPWDSKLVQRVYNLEERYLKQTSGRAPSADFELGLKLVHARALQAGTKAESSRVSSTITTLAKQLSTLQTSKLAPQTAPPTSPVSSAQPVSSVPPISSAQPISRAALPPADTTPAPTPPPLPTVTLRAPGPVLEMLTTPALTPSDDKLARRFIHFKAVYLERSTKHEIPLAIEESLVRLHGLALKAETATERMDVHRALDAWKAELDRAAPK